MNSVLKELALEAKKIKGMTEGEDTARAKEQNNGYTLELAEYPDFVIKRTTTRTTKTLAVMVSAGMAFIKTEHSKKEPVSEALSAENYRAFASEMPEILFPEGFWLKKLMRGAGAADALMNIMNDDVLLEMIRKKGTGEIDVLRYRMHIYPYGHDTLDRMKDAFTKYPALYTDLKNRQKSFRLLINEPSFINEMVKNFGIDGMRQFFEGYDTALIDMSPDSNYDNLQRGYNTKAVLPRYPMKASSCINYILYSSVRMGYAMNLRNFFGEWEDTLNMQTQLYGKIRDKYPQSLPTLHQQLSYKCLLAKMKIDEEKFAKQVEEARKYEGTYKGFTFVAPKSRQDFFDEATAQANCLAGYVNNFTNGDCLILFMRKQKSPDVSYITMEIIGDELGQIKLAENHDPAPSFVSIARQWIWECNKGKNKIAV